MKHLFTLMMVLSTSSFAGSNKVGSCDVNHVYVGKGSTYLKLENCSTELGFSSKDFELLHSRSMVVCNPSRHITEKVSYDNMADVLGMKQTAELAYLFQKKLFIEINNANELVYISLMSPVDLHSKEKVTPPPPPPPPSPDSNPTSPGDGFQPVPKPD